MEKERINEINKQVFKKFPYLAGCTPDVHPRPDGCVQLTYSKTAKTENQVALPISVKVTVSPEGEIIKMISSK